MADTQGTDPIRDRLPAWDGKTVGVGGPIPKELLDQLNQNAEQSEVQQGVEDE